MKLNSIIKTTLDNKEFVLYDNKTRMYYTDDKQRSTPSKAEIASWLGCDETDIIPVATKRYMYTAGLIEADPDNSDRVRLSFWSITNTQMGDLNPFTIKLITNKDRFAWREYESPELEYTPYIYVYNNGKISHEDAPTVKERIANQKPHTVRSLYKITTVATGNPIKYAYNYVMDLRVLNLCSEDPTTTSILKAAGFPNKYNVEGVLDFIITHESIKPVSKQASKFITSLKPMGDEEKIKIEKTANGTMFRFKTKYLNYAESGENGQVLINNDGTISQVVVDSYDEHTGRKTWKSISTEPRWFYQTLCDLQNKIKPEDVQNLLLYNKKFKYINEYINNNIQVLLRTHTSKDAFRHGSGLIEFLRMANKFPVLVDTFLKLGYEDIFTSEVRYLETVEVGQEPKFRIDNATSTSQRDVRSFDWVSKCYKNYVEYSYTCKEYTSGKLYDTDMLGPLNKGTRFFEILNISKEQWKYIVASKKELCTSEWLSVIASAKKWFLGDCKESEYGYYVSKENRIYQSLKDVPFPMFKEFVDLWHWFTARYKHTTSYSYYYTDMIYELSRNGYSISEGELNKPLFARLQCQERYKLMKYCAKYNYNFTDYHDYLRMRQQCADQHNRYYDAKDWPVMIPWDKLQLYHDRLVEIYNTSANEQRKEYEQANQQLYNKLIPKLKQFNFETEDDDRCIVCPEDLMEIVVEGQRLSHCVGSYTGSVARGNEVILFLRNKLTKDQSYATIDISYDKESKLWKVRQVHTRHNGDITTNDKEFLLKWGKLHKIDLSTIQEHYGALGAL